jgi:hypothetical protein
MTLRAVVKGSTGKTKHTVGEFVEGKPVAVKSLPVPAWVEISAEDGAFYLLHFNANGTCVADTWHQTLDEAKRQAEFEFGITPDEWTSVSPTGSMQADTEIPS